MEPGTHRHAVRGRRAATEPTGPTGAIRASDVSLWYVEEPFTDEERARLAPYFTNLEGPCSRS